MRRLRRSLLITPVFERRLVEKSVASIADVCWLEIEDGALDERKDEARELAVAAIREIDFGDKEHIVRVNPPGTQRGLDDVRIVAEAAPSGVFLAKVESADEIREVDNILAKVDSDRADGKVVSIWCMIETAKAIVNVEQIAAASPRLQGLVFGGADLGVTLGIKRLPLRQNILPPTDGMPPEWAYARGRLLVAGKAYGLSCIDMMYNSLRNMDAVHWRAQQSFQIGFDGICCLSPAQVVPVHRAWAPTPDEMDWAREVLRLQAEGAQSGKSVVTMGSSRDEFLDGPMFRNAAALVKREREAASGYYEDPAPETEAIAQMSTET